MASSCSLQTDQLELRTTQSTITFAAPFRLEGVPLLQAAGTYKVDCDEQTLEPRLYLRVGGSIRIRAVDGADLQAALNRDQKRPPPDNLAGPILQATGMIL